MGLKPFNKNNILTGSIRPQLNMPKESIGKIFFEKLKSNIADGGVILQDADGTRIHTRETLCKESIKFAIALKKMGVSKNDVVAIITENSPELIISVIACFYLGTVVTPVNPSYTPHELQHVFGIAKPRVILTREGYADKMKTLQEKNDTIKHIVAYDSREFCEMMAQADAETDSFQVEEVDDINKDRVAILFSSGTTGLQKGVVLTQASCRDSFDCCGNPAYIVMENKTTVGIVPSFLILGLFVNLSCVYYGMKLVIMDKFKADVYLGAIEKYKANCLVIAPPIATFFAKHPCVGSFNLSSVEDIICGGAPLPMDIHNKIKERLNITCREVYGMTEMGGLISISPFTETKLGSCGVLAQDTFMKVVCMETDKNLGPNERGELCVKSPRAMKEYIGTKTTTDAAFDADGFLHTGDVGYYDEDGFIFVVDRLKELIKYKGYQVAPAEVEAILLNCKGVKDGCVIGLPDERAGELPLAFVVKQPGVEVAENDIVKYVAGIVSEPKQLHGGVRFIDEIPRSPTGKVLRRKLKELLLN